MSRSKIDRVRPFRGTSHTYPLRDAGRHKTNPVQMRITKMPNTFAAFSNQIDLIISTGILARKQVRHEH